MAQGSIIVIRRGAPAPTREKPEPVDDPTPLDAAPEDIKWYAVDRSYPTGGSYGPAEAEKLIQKLRKKDPKGVYKKQSSTIAPKMRIDGHEIGQLTNSNTKLMPATEVKE